MYIIYVRNYRKDFYLSVIMVLWIILFILTEMFLNSSLTANVTIDNSFSFLSCQIRHRKYIYK